MLLKLASAVHVIQQFNQGFLSIVYQEDSSIVNRLICPSHCWILVIL